MTTDLDQDELNSHTWRYYAWDKFFNIQQIKELNELIDKEYNGFEDVKLATDDYPDGTIVKNISTVKVISYGKIKRLVLNLINNAYYCANFDFGYTTFGPYNQEVLNFNIYTSDTKDYYAWHTDSSRSPMYDMKLTLLINLSTEPYEGGEFQLGEVQDKYTGASILNEPGSALMFKSHIRHRVLPVTSGTRKTLTMFIHGPKFR